MKKILLILFLFLSCYIIYAKTYDDKKFYLAVGDGITAGYNDIIINYLDNLDVLKDHTFYQNTVFHLLFLQDIQCLPLKTTGLY